MTSKEIRQKFLDYFASKKHTIVPSASMVVKNDPTLMFTNAGMNQFKDIFLGNASAKFYRAADSQKCLRVSGKHNDLEEVGHDTYHHTMFEMLGNWSFGDYFKKEAIDWAWELLTEVYKIDKSLLYATIFEGSDECPMDTEAKEAWLKHLPEDHIVLGNKHDNFWEMGDTGPCGPCSEIHIDIRTPEEKASGILGRDLVNQSDPHVIEIWNLVFMQFQRLADGHLESLPAKNIDTGMGFERLCAVLQGKNSNYDTDVFSGMLAKIGEISGHRYGEGNDTDVAMRVIADHIRAISFSIADGQLPGNVKAGYVIRRILRRAVRYGYTFLGFNEPFLCRLVQQLVNDMGDAYPELGRQQQLIESVIREEENAFLRTIDTGIKFLDEHMSVPGGKKEISGEQAFMLYDTYGFPIDLTQLIASEHGYIVDMEGFNAQLQKQKDRARNATVNEFGDWEEFFPGEVKFMGYEKTRLDDVKLLRQRTVRQGNKTMIQLVFNYTPFYAEKGGQVGDTGYIISDNGEKIRILNTVEDNKLIVHIAEKLPENCHARFTLQVDEERRLNIAANHTATHLLDNALREILGTHVEQKGSFVNENALRFDFSHFEKLSDIGRVALASSFVDRNSGLFSGTPDESFPSELRFFKDAEGNITTVYATYDPNSKSGTEGGNRKTKATINWVECNSAIDAEARLYDRLFACEDPSAEEGDFRDLLNPDSLKIVNCKVEGALAKEMHQTEYVDGIAQVNRYQFLKQGYFVVDPDTTADHLVFNRTASLKDNWQKKE